MYLVLAIHLFLLFPITSTTSMRIYTLIALANANHVRSLGRGTNLIKLESAGDSAGSMGLRFGFDQWTESVPPFPSITHEEEKCSPCIQDDARLVTDIHQSCVSNLYIQAWSLCHSATASEPCFNIREVGFRSSLRLLTGAP